MTVGIPWRFRHGSKSLAGLCGEECCTQEEKLTGAQVAKQVDKEDACSCQHSPPAQVTEHKLQKNPGSLMAAHATGMTSWHEKGFDLDCHVIPAILQLSLLVPAKHSRGRQY